MNRDLFYAVPLLWFYKTI